jgi:hypothetical protein
VVDEEAQKEEIRIGILKDAITAEVVTKTGSRKWTVITIVGLAMLAMGLLLGLLLRDNSEPSEATELQISDDDFLVDLLTPISGGALLNESSSPQFEAFNWLASEANYAFPVIQNTSTSILIERYVIALLYFATDGPNWVSTFEFLGNSSVCEWPPVQENERETTQGVRCNSDGPIAKLLLVRTASKG